ncbi:IS3 family transposase [Paenibacillus sp. FSL R7-0331]|uniref:IS3 family transposase n=1 Tax=Paenibacillus sp. FSL R7-0331 TaxID=1536773 RepID=UPI0009DD4B00
MYGCRRVKVWLKRNYAIYVNHRRVQRHMGELGLQVVIRRKSRIKREAAMQLLTDEIYIRRFGK